MTNGDAVVFTLGLAGIVLLVFFAGWQVALGVVLYHWAERIDMNSRRRKGSTS